MSPAMNRAASRLVLQSYDEARVRAAAEEMRAELGGSPTFALAFLSSGYTPHLAEFQEIVAVHNEGRVRLGSQNTHGLALPWM